MRRNFLNCCSYITRDYEVKF
uniref:Uncharacterized protein n=1 Tax=Arundo donax TaxID=35708 RepID=A0A0A9B3S2_ARUDO